MADEDEALRRRINSRLADDAVAVAEPAPLYSMRVRAYDIEGEMLMNEEGHAARQARTVRRRDRGPFHVCEVVGGREELIALAIRDAEAGRLPQRPPMGGYNSENLTDVKKGRIDVMFDWHISYGILVMAY